MMLCLSQKTKKLTQELKFRLSLRSVIGLRCVVSLTINIYYRIRVCQSVIEIVIIHLRVRVCVMHSKLSSINLICELDYLILH